MNIFERFRKEIVLTSVLLLSGVFFSISLYSLNQELLKLNIMQMILYKKCIICRFFICWILLMFLNAYTLHSIFKSRRKLEAGADLILLIILMAITILIGVITIYLIQNPILRTISLAIVLSGVFLSNE